MPQDSYTWTDVKDAVADALELPAPERAAFLDRTCPDPGLRSEVERLLQACERAAASRTFLDEPAAAFAAALIDEMDEQERGAPTVLQAELAGRYTIERQLGRGGMATVYLAQDVRHGRRVALKVVPAGVSLDASPSFGGLRFQREIEIAARLTHPHILPLHDSGGAAGQFYYTMPYVDGESLRDRLDRTGPQPLDVTLHVLRDVTRALAHAHRHGIVHRDIKPGNILLNQEGDALVSDFGVAKALAAASSESTADADLSTTHIVLGTPAYIAPEQAAGDPLTDHRADLYSLGVVAYEMLTGRPPFAGRSSHELIVAHFSEAPEPLTNRRPDASPALATLVTRLLAKRPDDRPRDAAEVLDALDAASTDPALLRAAPASGASHRRSRRFALIGAGLLLAVATLIGVVNLSRRAAARGEPSIAVLPFANTSGGAEDDAFSDGLTDELIGALSNVPNLKVAARTSTFALKGKGLSASTIGDTLGVTTVLEGSVRRDGDRIKVSAQLVECGEQSRCLVEELRS